MNYRIHEYFNGPFGSPLMSFNSLSHAIDVAQALAKDRNWESFCVLDVEKDKVVVMCEPPFVIEAEEQAERQYLHDLAESVMTEDEPYDGVPADTIG